MKKTVGAATIFILAFMPILAAEEGTPENKAVPAPETAAATAAYIFSKSVDLWLAVYKQTKEEADITSILDELCREKGYTGYREYSAATEKLIGADWEALIQKEFHMPWAKAKVAYEIHARKLAEEDKAREKDPMISYVPDKAAIVYLKNGSTIEGIARKGVLAEKVVKFRRKNEVKVESIYVQVPSAEKDAGIRIWYINNIDGFTFIPYSSIDEKQGVEVVRTLTPRESEQIFKEIKVKEETLRDAEKRAKAEEDRLNKEKSQTEKAMREAEIARRRGVDLDQARKERQELLTKFPPSAGWSSEKLAEIRRRWIINHIPPTEIERDFLGLFDKWQKAKEEQEQIDGRK